MWVKIMKLSETDRRQFSFSKTDLAVGAPNVETVYVYRSYPVVKIVTNVYLLRKELLITDTSFKLKACWSLESKTVKQAGEEHFK